MKRNETAIIFVLVVLAAGSLLIGLDQLFLNGILGDYVMQKEFWFMLTELFLLFSWNFYILNRKCKSYIRISGILGSIILFTWCHQTFLPMIVSGVYCLFILLLGKWVRQTLIIRKSSAGFVDQSACFFADFLIGSSVWITGVCFLSAIGYGGIPTLRLVALLSLVVLLVLHCINSRDRTLGIHSYLRSLILVWEKGSRHQKSCFQPAYSKKSALMFSFILTMLALQVGRMNVAVDYDSLHYGLRSQYILNNGSGIYENLGNINLVYTYSKGLEVLNMPLSGTSSYGYVLSFNIWITVGILMVSYQIVKELTNKRYGLLAVAVLSALPGIMNMSITAKSDCITLLFQLILVYFMLCYLRQEDIAHKTGYFVLSGCACLATYLYKPTSLIFSTVIYFMSILYLLVIKNARIQWKNRWWLVTIPVITSWVGIWFRTFLLTGVPITSVFTSIFRFVGFEVKPPFAFADIPNSGGELGMMESIKHLMTRLFRMCTSPVGEDMDHVILAWGTGLTLVLFAAAILLTRQKQNRETQLKQTQVIYLYTIFIPFTVVCAFSIYMLWQVDGNYFMLFYALVTMLAVIAVSHCTLLKVRVALKWILIPMLIFNVVVTCLTNWTGRIGFSPVRIMHEGFYNHMEEAWLEKVELGNAQIWNMLAAEPKTRVIAMGKHPDVLSFPCNVQSYYDVTGSGGNVVLVKTLDNFKEFLRYAKTEYLYIEDSYIEEEKRAGDIVRYMIEDGSLIPVIIENGNMLGAVNLSP